MTDATEDALDALLRKQFEGPVPVDGFCERVMDRLPVRRRRSTWPLIAGAATGMTTCWFSLWSAPITSAGWRDWLAGELSASTAVLFVAMLSMAALALAWTVAEADDRYDPSFRRIVQ